MGRGLKTTVTDLNVRSFQEKTIGELDNLEHALVVLETDGTVSRRASGKTTLPVIGTFLNKLQSDRTVDTSVNIRLFGKNGTMRVMQQAAIVPGSPVYASNTTNYDRVIGLPTGQGGLLGYKLGSTNGAAGDIIEILDVSPNGGGSIQIAAGVHTWGGGAATTDTIANTNVAAGDVVLLTISVPGSGSPTVAFAVVDPGVGVDLTLDQNGQDATTKIFYQVIRPVA